MTAATQMKCACNSCSCTISTDSAVQKDGKYYCCEACANGHADGAGCGQPDCSCAH